MIVGRKLKRNIFIDTDIDCQNCGSWQRVCTWNGECDNLKPMTNEEWFCSLPTEEKAVVLDLKFNSANVCRLPTYNEIVEWLKQPHREE